MLEPDDGSELLVVVFEQSKRPRGLSNIQIVRTRLSLSLSFFGSWLDSSYTWVCNGQSSGCKLARCEIVLFARGDGVRLAGLMERIPGVSMGLDT